MPDLDHMTDEQKIKLARLLLRDIKEAKRRGVHPMEVLDERTGRKLPRSSGWPCTLLKWTDHDQDADDELAREERVIAQAHIGKKGVTVYASTENTTLVRFPDGAEVWCDTTDLLID